MSDNKDLYVVVINDNVEKEFLTLAEAKDYVKLNINHISGYPVYVIGLFHKTVYVYFSWHEWVEDRKPEYTKRKIIKSIYSNDLGRLIEKYTDKGWDCITGRVSYKDFWFYVIQK